MLYVNKHLNVCVYLYCPFKREFIIVSGNYFNYKDYIFFTFKFILHNSLLYIRVSHYLHILYVPEIFAQIKLCTFGSCTYTCATETLHSTQTEGRGTCFLTRCESYRNTHSWSRFTTRRIHVICNTRGTTQKKYCNVISFR